MSNKNVNKVGSSFILSKSILKKVKGIWR